MKIGIFVGSLRKGSYNRLLAKTLIQIAPPSLEMEIIEIGQLPFFNEDFEANPPKEWVEFRNTIKPLKGLIFVTPEYNRSVAPALKNALDVGSRPYGQNTWNGKPCAIISATIGTTGGFGANHHLRQSMVFLNCPCLQQPEAYISQADKLFDKDGTMINEGTKEYLKKFLEAFADWVKTNAK